VPLYEYECLNCKAQFEKLVFNSQTEVLCSACGSPRVAQKLSVFAVGSSQGTAKTAPDAGPCGNCEAAQRGLCGGAS
jgi:putative FmdB family regulatory protein